MVAIVPVAFAGNIAVDGSNSDKKTATKKANGNAVNASRKSETTPNKIDTKSIEIDRKKVEAFVGKHQQGLVDLLDFLREKQPSQYERAMRDIDRVMTRLENLERRDTEMHAIELELWQIRSQQRLVAAEWAAASKESRQQAAEARLKRLLEEEQRQDLKRLALLQKRARAQVEKLTQQMKEKRTNVDSAVEKGLRTWKSRIDKGPRKKTKAASEQQSATDKVKK